MIEKKTYEDAAVINTERFELKTPEYYVRNIPKFYREKVHVDSPMVNGVRVSWDEYLKTHPEMEDPRDHVPDPVYRTFDMNMSTSMEPASAVVDYLDNNVDFYIANPAYAYPRIIAILEAYLEVADDMSSMRTDIVLYCNKVRAALRTLKFHYESYKANQTLRTTGKLPSRGKTEYDRIAAQFRINTEI